MTAETLWLIAGTWVAIGIVVAFFMYRLGHDFWAWLMVAVILGPLSVPLAIERGRYHSQRRDEADQVPATPPSGFDLLVAVDGSDDSVRALHSALGLFGDDVTGIVLATVLDFDAESAPAAEPERAAAQDMLETVAGQIEGPVSTEVLYGPPATALADYARRQGCELLVVGARGRGATKALFGSVTAKLVGGSETPVFVGPALPD